MNLKYNKKIIVTGAAGFIGFHLSRKLIKNKINIIGVDNINDYYDVNLKKSRLSELEKESKNNSNNFIFYRSNINDYSSLKKIFDEHNPDIVFHLAAQAGVRYSLQNPFSYINSNIVGFLNILECCRHKKIKNFIYASSSSVYGGNTKVPFSEEDSTNHPVSLYAATKKSNELMAHSYSHLYNIPSIGLRFFTIYGPWGRPDMAPMIFTESILSKKTIRIFNHGEMARDFTYIDDAVEILLKLIEKPPSQNKNFDRNNPSYSSSWAPHRIFNIGNRQTVNLMEFIHLLEEELGIKSKKEFVEMQPGDIQITSSNTDMINEYINYQPNTDLRDGTKELLKWYIKFYKS